ncbi:zinc finger BED domain-containing protein 4-like isoform X2 [Synchiropus splendidus]|uniref:zinc finger BED domain-containing protein 4-like isoform X2 n=1 Tax=Synchiropus splendidus TaxID=270530 RepID=UPI00237D8D44|nr:zinc finger BED domain-containing protein 4-like isoform X2 [Synchiropus splendidus]
MEPSRERKFSPVWEHFNLISANKVKCRLCSKELRYNNNTSSMLRHYWALHETKETGPEQPSIDDRSGVDDALVDMVILDSQPFSFVEDKGFKKLVAALNPGNVLPTRQALKAMVEKRYEELKEKAKVLVSTASAVSLTSDMWTSINTNAYLAVTGHFIDTSTTLQTVVLGGDWHSSNAGVQRHGRDSEAPIKGKTEHHTNHECALTADAAGSPILKNRLSFSQQSRGGRKETCGRVCCNCKGHNTYLLCCLLLFHLLFPLLQLPIIPNHTRGSSLYK